MAVFGTSKAKIEKEGTRLKLELEQTVVGFAKEIKELEVLYQHRVDDMFFYDYRCCMKKNGITNDIPSIPSDEENDVVLGRESQVRERLNSGRWIRNNQP